VWNALPGVSPVKRFTDRATAVRRIWKAIQNLQPAAPTALPKGTRERSKKVQVLTLLERPEGVSVQEIMAVTAWQAHTVRGFLSGTVGKRMGLRVTSERRADGQRAYRLQGHHTHGEP